MLLPAGLHWPPQKPINLMHKLMYGIMIQTGKTGSKGSIKCQRISAFVRFEQVGRKCYKILGHQWILFPSIFSFLQVWVPESPSLESSQEFDARQTL